MIMIVQLVTYSINKQEELADAYSYSNYLIPLEGFYLWLRSVKLRSTVTVTMHLSCHRLNLKGFMVSLSLQFLICMLLAISKISWLVFSCEEGHAGYLYIERIELKTSVPDEVQYHCDRIFGSMATYIVRTSLKWRLEELYIQKSKII